MIGRDRRRGQARRGGLPQGPQHRASAGVVAQGGGRAGTAPVRQRERRAGPHAIDHDGGLPPKLREGHEEFQGSRGEHVVGNGNHSGLLRQRKAAAQAYGAFYALL